MNRNRSHRRSGFTLIELLLVLVILAVLAGIVIPKFAGKQKQARETAARTQVKSFETSIDAFEVEVGRYPTDSDGGLNALVSPPSGTSFKAMFKEIPKDPWGNPYQYRQPGTHNPSSYDVFSFGEDGREGNDDVGNWSESK
ncbi:MAG: type II secretion system major pseudopilin GspG [Tepidisphaeraceae bacterium]